jgi:hypothetical protein
MRIRIQLFALMRIPIQLPKIMRIQNRNPDFLNAVYVPIKLCKVERMNLCWGEQADVDDFTKLGVDPPGPEHNSFLSANFGHSAFKPLQWRFVHFFPLPKIGLLPHAG